MGYKKTANLTATSFFHIDGISSSQFKSGEYTIVKDVGYSPFNTTLKADIGKESALREFNYILFQVKVKIDGLDATKIDLNNLDLQIDLYAKVVTKVSVSN